MDVLVLWKLFISYSKNEKALKITTGFSPVE